LVNVPSVPALSSSLSVSTGDYSLDSPAWAGENPPALKNLFCTGGVAMKRACYIAVVALVLAGTCFAESARQVELVAEVSLTNQTGLIAGTLYTPKDTGMFRASLYLQCTEGDPQDVQGITMTLEWTDDVGSERFAFNIADSEKGAPTSQTFLIKGQAGIPIDWNISVRGSNAIYEVYLALERIGPKVQ
jgi:hypothetical protein